MNDSMTPRERVLGALKREPVDRIPYVEHYFHPRVAIDIAGGPDKFTSDERALRSLESGEFDALDISAFAWIEVDISRVVGRDNIVYWGAFGPFEGGKSYLLDPKTPELGFSSDGILKTRSDLDKMAFRKLDDAFWEPARKFVESKGNFAANAMLWLGIDPTWHSMGFEHFAVCLAENPGFVEEILGRIADWCAEVAKGLCEIGFDFIWAADDIAYKTAPLFSPKMYREVLLPHTRRVAENITIPWAYHSDGNLMPILDDMLTQGMNAIHPLEPGSMDLRELKRRYGDRIAFIGNINMDLLARGTPEEVRQEVKERIALMGPGYGYLISSSNSIAEYCKPENVVAMVEAIKEFGRYPLKV
ncbi:MAG: uroporphyrinogen decarboxylase family protein [bacterium]